MSLNVVPLAVNLRHIVCIDMDERRLGGLMERSLVERARAGDRNAFEELARSRIDSVYRTAYAMLGNTQDAQDATQDALTSAWRSLSGLKDPWILAQTRTPGGAGRRSPGWTRTPSRA